jgi:hypothetical protein
MAVLVHSMVEWYVDNQGTMKVWASAQAELLGYFISCWICQHTGESCCTCDMVESLKLDVEDVQRTEKTWEKDLDKVLRYYAALPKETKGTKGKNK